MKFITNISELLGRILLIGSTAMIHKRPVFMNTDFLEIGGQYSLTYDIICYEIIFLLLCFVISSTIIVLVLDRNMSQW